MANNNKSIELEVNVTGKGIKELKSELREMQSQIAAATDPEQANKFAEAAGKIKDRIVEVNEQIKVMTSGSGFEKVANGLGLIKDQLLSLDFEGAADSARNLTTTIKGLNPTEVANQFKGLASTIGQLGNAFFQMGLKLLANPIFLLVAVIVAVVAAIVMLKDKLKIAEKAFDIMMIPIKAVIQALKDLTDWLGITAFAAEEKADRVIAANEKESKSAKIATDKKVAELDREIARLEAAGLSTVNVEIEKQKELKRLASEELDRNRRNAEAIVEVMKGQTKAQKEESQKQLDQFNENIRTENENYKNAKNEIEVINLKHNKAINDENAKARETDRQKAIAAEKKKQEELKRIKDEALNNIKDDNSRLRQITADNIKEIQDMRVETETERIKLDKQRELDELEQSRVSMIERLKIHTLFGDELKLAQEQILQNDIAYREAKKAINEKYDVIDAEYQVTLNDEQRQRDIDWAAEKLQREEEERKKLLAVEEAYQAAHRDLLLNGLSVAKSIFGKSKELALVALALEKGIAIADIVVNASKSLATITASTAAANAAALATAGNPIIAAPLIAANTALGLKQAIATKVSAAAGIASVLAATITSAKGITSSGGGGGDTGGGVGGGGTPGGTQTQITPSFTLVGGANNNNTATAAQTVDSGRMSSQRVYVLESDITGTQGRVNRYASNSEL